jgi:hypothetical protein
LLLVDATGQPDVRQQRRAGLWDTLLRCLLLSARGGVRGVVLQRLAVQLQDVVAGAGGRALLQLLNGRVGRLCDGVRRHGGARSADEQQRSDRLQSEAASCCRHPGPHPLQ